MLKQKFNARRLALAGAVAAALGASTSIEAGTATSSLSVTATVAANCTITTTTLAFGAYDPVVTNASTPLTGTGAVNITCTTGSPVTITLDQGLSAGTGSTDAAPARRLTDGATHYLTYELYQDSGHATVWGNTAPTGEGETGTGTQQVVTVYGSVDAGQNIPTGSYADTVTATVTF